MLTTPARRVAATLLLPVLFVLVGCSTPAPPRSPAAVRADIVRRLPASVADRQGWAADIQAAFAALAIAPTTSNLCAVLAVTEQESTFEANPEVPGLAKIARAEIDRRAARVNIPPFLVRAALAFESPNGRRYDDRLAAVRTEHDLDRIFEDFMNSVPMGKRLLQGANPVRTAGPMQVSIAYAQQHTKTRAYPYPLTGSIRQEVFTRRGGMYFGIAHLLGYPVSYDRKIFRFADYNAGFYASRNAAFQQAVSLASGIPVTLDGDLIAHEARGDGGQVGTTEAAVRSLAVPLGLSEAQIHRALRQGGSFAFERTDLYRDVFAIAERQQHRPLPRAVIPRIRLDSPKITRKLTTQWFATRVDQRYRRCMAKGG